MSAGPKGKQSKDMATQLAIIYKPIRSLEPYANNARTHSPDQIYQIARSIQKFGFTNPVLVDGKNGVIAGHGRILAAKELGMSEVPTIELASMTEAQKRAYIIADNKLALNAGWDNDILRLELAEIRELGEDLSITGFSDDEIASLMGPTAGLTDPDDIPEVVEAVSRLGDCWVLGNHRLICGDSTDSSVLARILGPAQLDCVFTSPPYAVGVDYGGYDDTIDNLREMLPKLASQWINYVRPGGFAVVNFGDLVKGKDAAGSVEMTEYPMALEYWPAFTSSGWKLWTRRIWCKPRASAGSMQCIQSNRAATNWEHVWTWRKDGPRMFVGQITGNYPSQTGWFDTTHEHKLTVGLDVHGAGMPVTVASRGLIWHSKIHGACFEPFSGTGTTIIAAEMTGRHCYAIEINPAYVDIAVKRWENFTGKKAVLDGSPETA